MITIIVTLKEFKATAARTFILVFTCLQVYFPKLLICNNFLEYMFGRIKLKVMREFSYFGIIYMSSNKLTVINVPETGWQIGPWECRYFGKISVPLWNK